MHGVHELDDHRILVVVGVCAVSKLIPAVVETAPEPTPVDLQQVTASVVRQYDLPRDVMRAIEREAEHDPSDPFLARRLAAHYRQGIWVPTDGGAR